MKGDRGEGRKWRGAPLYSFNLYVLQSHLPQRLTELDLFTASLSTYRETVLNVTGWHASPWPWSEPFSLSGPLMLSWDCWHLLHVRLTQTLNEHFRIAPPHTQRPKWITKGWSQSEETKMVHAKLEWGKKVWIIAVRRSDRVHSYSELLNSGESWSSVQINPSFVTPNL